jgi:hypothetical protein
MAFDEAGADRSELALLNLDKDGKPHLTIADHTGSWLNRWREILRSDVMDKEIGS